MRPPLLSTAALALTLALSGCTAPSTHDAGAFTSDGSGASTAGPDIPHGFHDIGNGLAAKGDTEHRDDCLTSIGSCYVIDVYAYRDCSVYAEMNGLDSSGTIVDYSNDTATMSAGDTARLTFQFTQSVDDFHFTKFDCN